MLTDQLSQLVLHSFDFSKNLDGGFGEGNVQNVVKSMERILVAHSPLACNL